MAYKIHIDWGGCCCEDKCCDKEKKEIEIKPGKCIDVDKSVEWEYTINNTMEVEIKSSLCDSSTVRDVRNGRIWDALCSKELIWVGKKRIEF